MVFCIRLHEKNILHVVFHDRLPNLIPNLETLSGSLPSNFIVISDGSVLGAVLGDAHRNSNFDIWCSMAALPCLCHLLAAQGILLMRLIRKYGQHSNPLISHVEQYCLHPAQGKRFRFGHHEIYGTWNYDDCAALANIM